MSDLEIQVNNRVSSVVYVLFFLLCFGMVCTNSYNFIISREIKSLKHDIKKLKRREQAKKEIDAVGMAAKNYWTYELERE